MQDQQDGELRSSSRMFVFTELFGYGNAALFCY